MVCEGLIVSPVATGLLVDKVVEGEARVEVGVGCEEDEDVNVCEVEGDADDCEELVFAVEVTATGVVDVVEVVLAVVL